MVNKFLYNKGGSESYMFTLANYLKEMGHGVFYFGMYDKKNEVKKNDYLTTNVQLHKGGLKSFLRAFSFIYSPEARKKIKGAIKAFKPDIIHLNNYNYELTPSIIYGIKKYRIPIVQTVHDFQMICPHHRLYNFQMRSICEKCAGNKYFQCALTKCIGESLPKSLVGTIEAYFYLSLRTYRFIDEFICPSNFMMNRLVGEGFDKKKITVMHNFTVQVTEKSCEDERYVLYFGRLSEEKGIEILVKAAKRTPDVRYVIAGDGPMREILSGINNIDYRRFLQGEELKDLIKKSSFTVLPSEWYENCSMSILESFSSGKPVIASIIGGNTELVNDGINGLLFYAGNDEQLTEKIEYLYNNPSVIEKFSIECIKKAKELSIENYYSKLMDIYKKCLLNESERR